MNILSDQRFHCVNHISTEREGEQKSPVGRSRLISYSIFSISFLSLLNNTPGWNPTPSETIGSFLFDNTQTEFILHALYCLLMSRLPSLQIYHSRIYALNSVKLITNKRQFNVLYCGFDVRNSQMMFVLFTWI